MKISIISAGAAQSVVQQVAAAMQLTHALETEASFGAVGAQKQKMLAGSPADLIVLTAEMIEELIASGQIRKGSRMDLGAVVGGIAVRSGAKHPEVSSTDALAATLLSASAIYLPDPAIATAGRLFVQMCERLKIATVVGPKLRTFPNGFSAMTQMARSRVAGELGCTQITEIKSVAGVDLVAPLPEPLQTATVYSLGISSGAVNLETAHEFARRLAGPGAAAMLAAAGFGLR